MKIDQNISIQTNPVGFAASVLPRTMGKAGRRKRVILPYLIHLPEDWPFEDRVLAWLVPSLEREIVHFHAKNGAPLAKVFQPHQIAHLDEDFNMRLDEKLGVLSDIRTSQLFDLE